MCENWHVRVANIYGDFCCVSHDTVRYKLFKRKPILDFSVTNSDGRLTFTPIYIEQGYCLKFSFVRSDGNAKKLQEFM